jgi:L,D-peptidoglycan transpeptidase YkuD (ErfK/YbiS/YcfS/YnhG family)
MRRAIVWILTIIFITTLGFVVFYYQDQQRNRPITEIRKAREILSIAQNKGAKIYSNGYFKKASNSYDLAMAAWKAENKKSLFSRDYSKSKKLAKKSVELSNKAIELTQKNSLHAKEDLTSQIANLKNQLKHYYSLLSDIPLNEYQRTQLNKGKLNLQEGAIAFSKKDYGIAKDKISKADDMINPVIFYAQTEFDDYFKNDSMWQSWIAKSISISKNNNTSLIIVDKYAHECNVYVNGQKKYVFKIELGRNWFGNKSYQGDYSTPEGFYKIIDKKSHPRTNYYKAMLLNYPNDEDKARFRRNKKNGIISSNKGIGNNIEIHGEGGRGADWTKGCIALENSELDNLFAICNVGTMVTIVGSAKTKSELLKLE